MDEFKHNADHPRRILITGASGLLGEVLCRAASAEWAVFGLYRRHPLVVPGVVGIQTDLTDSRAMEKTLDTVEPAAVIHAAAMAQPAECEKHPDISEAVNVRVPEMLARCCAEREIPMVFTSTDLVFDGLQAPYGEDDPPGPVCVYARHKVRAEREVLGHHPHALVCRMPLLFGISAYHTGNFTVQLLHAMQQGRRVKLFTDEFRTPVDTRSAALGILGLLGKAEGVLHLGGRTRVSRHEMGLMIAARLGVDPRLVEPVTIASMALAVTRSPDCSLDSRRAYHLGYDPVPLPTAIARVVQEFETMTDKSVLT